MGEVVEDIDWCNWEEDVDECNGRVKTNWCGGGEEDIDGCVVGGGRGRYTGVMIRATDWFGWLDGVQTKIRVIEGKKSCFTIAYKEKILSRASGQCCLTEGEQHHFLFLSYQPTNRDGDGRPTG